MTNKYLEKIASLLKVAYDSDYETKTHYGVTSNRNDVLGKQNNDVVGSLRKAAKNPNLHVSVFSGSTGRHSSSKDGAEFHKHLDDIQSEVKDYEKKSGSKGMNWSRHHDWSVSMKKSHGSKSQIMDYLHKNVNI